MPRRLPQPIPQPASSPQTDGPSPAIHGLSSTIDFPSPPGPTQPPAAPAGPNRQTWPRLYPISAARIDHPALANTVQLTSPPYRPCCPSQGAPARRIQTRLPTSCLPVSYQTQIDSPPPTTSSLPPPTQTSPDRLLASAFPNPTMTSLNTPSRPSSCFPAPGQRDDPRQLRLVMPEPDRPASSTRPPS